MPGSFERDNLSELADDIFISDELWIEWLATNNMKTILIILIFLFMRLISEWKSSYVLHYMKLITSFFCYRKGRFSLLSWFQKTLLSLWDVTPCLLVEFIDVIEERVVWYTIMSIELSCFS